MAIEAPGFEVKWDDYAFLDHLRQCSDSIADNIIEKVPVRDWVPLLGAGPFRRPLGPGEHPLLRIAKNDELIDYLNATKSLPNFDAQNEMLVRIEKGSDAFWEYGLTIGVILVTKSLIEGYSSRTLSLVLAATTEFTERPYKRLINTLRMLVSVASVHRWEGGHVCPGGTHCFETQAIATAQALRLLHAALRRSVILAGKDDLSEGDKRWLARLRFRLDELHRLKDFQAEHQVPLNFEDMLAVVMGLSLLPVLGLRELELDFSDEDAENYYYVWRVFAVRMGIHPPDEPDSDAWVPKDLNEAELFYDTYKKRHYVDVEQNPEARVIAKSTLTAVNEKIFFGGPTDEELASIPRWFRGLRWLRIPHMYSRILVGKEGYKKVGLSRVPWGYVLEPILEWGPWLIQKVNEFVRGAFRRALKRPRPVRNPARTRAPEGRIRSFFAALFSVLSGRAHEMVSRVLFRYLIRRNPGGPAFGRFAVVNAAFGLDERRSNEDRRQPHESTPTRESQSENRKGERRRSYFLPPSGEGDSEHASG